MALIFLIELKKIEKKDEYNIHTIKMKFIIKSNECIYLFNFVHKFNQFIEFYRQKNYTKFDIKIQYIIYNINKKKIKIIL